MSASALRGRRPWPPEDPRKARPSASAAAAGQKLHIPIVVADQCTLLREGIAAICERDGTFRVVSHCGDGADAVQMILNVRPRLVLVDLNLADLDGLTVLETARLSGSKARFVCVSAQKDRWRVIEALRRGASGFVLKSDTAEQLLEAFRQAIAGSIYVSPQLELAEIFASRPAEPSCDPVERLSRRERQVFALLVEGFRPKEIATRLRLSPKTVDTHRANLMKKLEIQHLAGLVKYAVDRKLTRLR